MYFNLTVHVHLWYTKSLIVIIIICLLKLHFHLKYKHVQTHTSQSICIRLQVWIILFLQPFYKVSDIHWHTNINTLVDSTISKLIWLAILNCQVYVTKLSHGLRNLLLFIIYFLFTYSQTIMIMHWLSQYIKQYKVI